MADPRAHTFLDFEKPIAEIEGQIEELRHRDPGEERDPAAEIARLERRLERLVRETYGALNAWQKVQVARHPGRPHCLDYVGALIAEFVPLAGDRVLRRGLGHRRRSRPVPRPRGHGAGPRARLRHRDAREAQFRHGPARGLPQGAASDAPRRAVPPARPRADRHAGRLSRRRRRGARPGGGDRPCRRDLPRHPHAAGQRGHRRGRLGRRHRAGGRRPRADGRACGLFGDLARGVRVDPVARRGTGAARRPRRSSSPRRTCSRSG